ncbi:PilN domain-containing protein [Vibrio sp.]|uniref:PilN domain-containing protein n=1 Tax=Vibrio sp. TaxID=678 RepID=UPI003D0F1A83
MDVNVNLYPWREWQLVRHQRQFWWQLVGLFMLISVVALLGGQYFQRQIITQQQRLDFLQQYDQELQQQMQQLGQLKIEHRQLAQRLQLVEQLQTRLNRPVQLMNQLQQLVPEGVYLDKIKFQQPRVELHGISDSTARVATLLDRLESSPRVEELAVHSIVNGQKRLGESFQSFSLAYQFVANHEPDSQGGRHDH